MLLHAQLYININMSCKYNAHLKTVFNNWTVVRESNIPKTMCLSKRWTQFFHELDFIRSFLVAMKSVFFFKHYWSPPAGNASSMIVTAIARAINSYRNCLIFVITCRTLQVSKQFSCVYDLGHYNTPIVQCVQCSVENRNVAFSVGQLS